jgi:hypothetical protein
MKTRLISGTVLWFVVSIGFAPVSSHAQWYVGTGYSTGYPGYSYGVRYGYPGGLGYPIGYGIGLGGYSGAQTAFSADAMGMSNLVRAQGQYNEESAKAMLSYEQARKQYIENQQQAISAQAASRRVIQAEENKRREQAHESQVRGAQFAEAHKPMPLSSTQLDSTTGRIQWPPALQANDFDALRQSLDTLFETRAKYGITSTVSAQIATKSGELKDALRAHIRTLPLPEYTEARRFLESMAATVH